MKQPNYQERLKHYEHNIKLLGLKAKEHMTKYNISSAQITKVSGVPIKSVRHFVNGQSTPNLVIASTIIQTIEYIHKQQERTDLSTCSSTAH